MARRRGTREHAWTGATGSVSPGRRRTMVNLIRDQRERERERERERKRARARERER